MLFNSIGFILFFPVMLAVYHFIPVSYRYIWLLASSWFFYACFSIKCVPVLLGITLISFLGGLAIEKSGKPIYIVCLGLCIATLILFKYMNLDVRYSILVPVGISYYTFKAVSYMIDVYRGKITAERNFFKYALFVSFFTQLIAGPIDRADSLLCQIDSCVRPTEENLRHGALLMLWGYFEKLLIADRTAVLVNAVYNDHTAFSGAAILFATFLYGIQIYADFAGYSHLAIGASEILGYKVAANFRQPYLAMGIRDFWSRWHISMSAWFKDYVYIPLGGNRKGKIRKAVNNMITFLLSGLWHGGSLNFVAWGGIHGLYHIGADIAESLGKRYPASLKKESGRYPFSSRLLRITVTFIMVDLAWLFFRANSLMTAIDMIKRIVTDLRPYSLSGEWIYDLGLPEAAVRTILPGSLLLLVFDCLKEKGISITEWIDRQGKIFRWMIYISSILIVIMIAVQNLGVSSAEFIYFNF